MRASINRWFECPHCGSENCEFAGQGYRENAIKCNDCGEREGDGIPRKKWTDWMSCPDCGSNRVEGNGYRENKVECSSCGLEEGDWY